MILLHHIVQALTRADLQRVLPTMVELIAHPHPRQRRMGRLETVERDGPRLPVMLERLTALPPGFTLTDARGINDRGQIIANGQSANHVEAFLLTPVAALARYTIADLGTTSRLISGHATPADATTHAMLWPSGALGSGSITDLGTLGGPNIAALGVNDTALTVGETDTATPDPNGEDFCGFKALGRPSFGGRVSASYGKTVP